MRGAVFAEWLDALPTITREGDQDHADDLAAIMDRLADAPEPAA